MKGWSYLLHQTALELTAELERIAPQSLVLAKARGVFQAFEETGGEPSGRPPTRNRNCRREALAQKIVERDASDAEVKRLYESGLSLMEVGRDRGGRSTAWVITSLARTSTPTRPRGNHSHHPDPERIERIRTMRAEGKTLEEIGAVEHITRERVRQICNKAGIDTKLVRALTAEQQAAVDEYLAGANLAFVAEKYGVGAGAIRDWVYRAGHVPRRTRHPRLAKTKWQAERAAALYRQGKKGREIAADLGIPHVEMIYRLLAIAGVRPDRNTGAGRPSQ